MQTCESEHFEKTVRDDIMAEHTAVDSAVEDKFGKGSVFRRNAPRTRTGTIWEKAPRASGAEWQKVHGQVCIDFEREDA